MKIVEPKAWIIEDELEKLSVYQRIDRCASVCYQRPPKATEEEAKEFCMSMIKRKHWVPLEMAVLHLWVDPELCDMPSSKYLHKKRDVVSGSIRSFIESDAKDLWVGSFLNNEFPCLFNGSEYRKPWESVDIKNPPIRFAKEEEIPWQHKHVAVQVVCSRAISHQLVRHRPCSILQESQRYCRYDVDRFDGEVSYVRPLWTERGHQVDFWVWKTHMEANEDQYRWRLLQKMAPQDARGCLANDCKTELIIYASLPEWQHILNTDTMRCSPHADPEMRRIMEPLRGEFMERLPEVGW